jgi:hypothetical protein
MRQYPGPAAGPDATSCSSPSAIVHLRSHHRRPVHQPSQLHLRVRRQRHQCLPRALRRYDSRHLRHHQAGHCHRQRTGQIRHRSAHRILAIPRVSIAL